MQSLVRRATRPVSSSPGGVAFRAAHTSLRRSCASTAPLPPPTDIDTAVTHDTVASAHVHASCLLARLLRHRTPASLGAFVAVTEEWWRLTEQLVLLPVVAADLGQLLVEASQQERVQGAATQEAHAIDEWESWVWSSVPRLVPAPAVRDGDAGDPGAATPPELVSFAQFTSLLHSFHRYRRGVRWGASRNAGEWAARGENAAAAAAAYYRRLYYVHPWHGVHCPAGTALQMPFVHVLQWMLATPAGSSDAEGMPSAALWERHRALEPFQPRCTSAGSHAFTALDVCCQSGHVLGLLLRAGADVVVASDADPAALANTEATFHEYLCDAKGSSRRATLFTRRADGLPQSTEVRPVDRSEPGEAVAAVSVQHTSAMAAARRRQRARDEGRGYSGVGPAGGAGREESASAADGPFDVVYIHPPTEASLLPVAAAAELDLRRTMWWRGLQAAAAAEGIDTDVLLPCLPCATKPSSSRQHPLATLSGLTQAVGALRADVAEGGTLVAEAGHVVLVLPRTYDTHQLLRGGDMHGVPALADWVVAQLDGFYDLVLRRRCPVHGSGDGEAGPSPSAAALEAALFKVVNAARDSPADGAAAWPAELRRIARNEVWHDVLVLRRNAAMARQWAAQRSSPAVAGSTARRQRQAAAPVEWEESFEFNEYRPRGAAPNTSHHWTDLVPSFSYLEPDFFDSPRTSGNFLAVGHTVKPTAAGTCGGVPGASVDELGRVQDGVEAAAVDAADNFHSVFAQELRTRRRTKLRKLALSPLERQEWYIDEKLVKSGAAQLQLLNELSRFDLKDYDN